MPYWLRFVLVLSQNNENEFKCHEKPCDITTGNMVSFNNVLVFSYIFHSARLQGAQHTANVGVRCYYTVQTTRRECLLFVFLYMDRMGPKYMRELLAAKLIKTKKKTRRKTTKVYLFHTGAHISICMFA